MKKLLIATVAWLAVTATNTFAADLYSPDSTPAPIYTKAPPPTEYSWTGWYVGLDAGGAWAQSSDPTTTVFDPSGYFAASSVSAVNAAGAQSNNPAGFIGGAEVGGNVQWNTFVAGVEADFNYLGLRKSSSSSGAYPCCGPTTGFIINSSISTSWLATIRGRLGGASGSPTTVGYSTQPAVPRLLISRPISGSPICAAHIQAAVLSRRSHQDSNPPQSRTSRPDMRLAAASRPIYQAIGPLKPSIFTSGLGL